MRQAIVDFYLVGYSRGEGKVNLSCSNFYEVRVVSSDHTGHRRQEGILEVKNGRKLFRFNITHRLADMHIECNGMYNLLCGVGANDNEFVIFLGLIQINPNA